MSTGKTWMLYVTLALLLASCAEPKTAPASLPGILPTSSAIAMLSNSEPVKPTISAADVDLSGLPVITPGNANQVKRLFSIRGHSNRISDIAFSPDGTYLASSSWDGTVKLWDVKTGQEAHTFSIRKPDLNCIDFSPDGHLLASSAAIWDVESGQVVHTLEDGYSGGRVTFSPDGRLLVIAVIDGQVELWDPATGALVRTFDMPDDSTVFFDVVFSPDGTRVMASLHGDRVWIWDVASGQIAGMLEGGSQSNDTHAIDITKDGSLLVSGGTNPAVRLWDLASGESVRSLMNYSGLYDLTFSPDDSMVAIGGPNRTIDLWEVESGRMLKSLIHADELMTVAFSPDGKLLAGGGYDNTIVLWGIPR